jgi:hypothetical protein
MRYGTIILNDYGQRHYSIHSLVVNKENHVTSVKIAGTKQGFEHNNVSLQSHLLLLC